MEAAEKVATRSNESMINKHFRDTLTKQLHDFVIEGKQRGKGSDRFSRFFTSKKIFLFTIKIVFSHVVKCWWVPLPVL